MAENQANTTETGAVAVTKSTPALKAQFPNASDAYRLTQYQYYEQLFFGEHYDAFKMRISNDEYNKAYSKLRYVYVNFAGMISKIVADMLFSEHVTLKVEDGGDQEFVEELWEDNNMDTQCYESSLSNSYNGDALFKVRVGFRHPNDKKMSVIIEDINPRIYFPVIDPFNVRAEPLKKELSWVFKAGEKSYLRKEIHTPGYIYNEVYEMDGKNIGAKVPLTILGIPDMKDVEETGIEESLVIHIPNWKTGSRWNGISDYFDLDSLFFAINNRMTSIDNVLDKHTDPILMVPPGVIKEDGTVNKKALGVIELGEGDTGKPEYIVWDASLENAFKEIEKIVEFIYMVGEVSPDVLGLGQGKSDSGRALKFKLMRTIAKVARKKMYYLTGLQQVMYVAQLMAKAHNIDIDGKTMAGDAVRPDIEFADGIPTDDSELIDNESKAIDAGVTSKRDAMMRIYSLDEKTADQRLKDIEDEKPAIVMPSANMGGTAAFGKTDGKVDPATGKPAVPAKTPVIPAK